MNLDSAAPIEGNIVIIEVAMASINAPIISPIAPATFIMILKPRSKKSSSPPINSINPPITMANEIIESIKISKAAIAATPINARGPTLAKITHTLVMSINR